MAFQSIKTLKISRTWVGEGKGGLADCPAVFFFFTGGRRGLCNLLGGVGSAVALPGAMLPKLPKSKTPHSHRESCNRTVCLSQPLWKDFTKMPDIIFWHLYPWASQCCPRPNITGADFWWQIFPLSPSLTGFAFLDSTPPPFLYPPGKCMWWVFCLVSVPLHKLCTCLRASRGSECT